jgi:hypothetical protein
VNSPWSAKNEGFIIKSHLGHFFAQIPNVFKQKSTTPD